MSCGACVLNQIGFPVDIVDELSGRAARDGEGVFFSTVRDKINEVKNRLVRGAPPAHMYSWGAEWIGSRKNPRLVLSVVPEAERGQQVPFTSPGGAGLMAMAINQVFNTVGDGTAAVLAIRWADAQARDEGGHYVVIAKSRLGTPYLIEAQGGPSQGVYRGMKDIRGYFAGQANVARFITFNNSEPFRRGQNWFLDLDAETELDLSPLRDGQPVPLDAVEHRSMRAPPVVRTGSYESAYEEGAGSAPEHAASRFHQLQSSSMGGPPTFGAAPSQHVVGAFGTPAPPPGAFGAFGAPPPGAFGAPPPGAFGAFGAPPAPAASHSMHSQSSRQHKSHAQEPNPFNLTRHTNYKKKGYSDVFCDACGKKHIDGSYSDPEGDWDACFSCFSENREGINPLGLEWHTNLRRQFGDRITCDACGKGNLDASYHNDENDIDVCEKCFNRNDPVYESSQGGRRRMRRRTAKKRRSAGTRRK